MNDISPWIFTIDMQITNKAKYGIRIMLYIALESGNTLTVQDVFIREDVSKRYLEQIFAELKKQGLVMSIKGKNGGYYIHKPLKEINVYDIIYALEGEGDFNALTGNGDKDLAGVLSDRLWEPLKASLYELLGNITLEELMLDYQSRQGNMFYI